MLLYDNKLGKSRFSCATQYSSGSSKQTISVRGIHKILDTSEAATPICQTIGAMQIRNAIAKEHDSGIGVWRDGIWGSKDS